MLILFFLADAQSARAVEYTDCTSSPHQTDKTPPQRVSRI